MSATAEMPEVVIPAYITEAAEAIAATTPADPKNKLTAHTAVKLLSSLRAGAHYDTACALCGISYETFRRWTHLAEDDREDGPYRALMCAVKVAEAEAEFETIGDVRKASKDSRFWAAGMTFLERRHPDRWKRRDDNQVQVNVGVALGIQASDAQRQALVPQVVIREIAPENADRSPCGTDQAALSPAPESLSPVSPIPQTAVSVDQGEAKGPPTGGVSPPRVA